MTTDEKLKKFYDTTIQAATEQAEQIVTDYQNALDKLYQEHINNRNRRDKMELDDEKEKLKRETNRELSAEQLQARRSMSVKSQELKEALFTDVIEKLKEFKTGKEYVPYLCRKIKEASVELPGKTSEIIFFIDASDASLKDTLAEQTGMQIRIAEEHFLGGIQALIPDRHILIDHSFASMLAEEQAGFNPEGGITHV